MNRETDGSRDLTMMTKKFFFVSEKKKIWVKYDNKKECVLSVISTNTPMLSNSSRGLSEESDLEEDVHGSIQLTDRSMIFFLFYLPANPIRSNRSESETILGSNL
jgi:hypothetical protein